MSLITTTNLAKSYGAQDIFSGLSVSIPPDGRIALVGPNGIGKTTLLRLMAGLDTPSEGKVQRARRLKIGYLTQERGTWDVEEPLESRSHTLWEECLLALADLRAMEADLARLEEIMSAAGSSGAADGGAGDSGAADSGAGSDNADDVLATYGKLQAEFERRGGYTYPARVRHILQGLGFSDDAFHQPIQQLSSGQQTRAVLARLLLSAPDLLILDEPTNHLDIEAVEWLEGYLSYWPGAALIVSHDRYFIDKVCNHIWEMMGGGIEVYHGNYTAYLQQREARWEHRQQTFLSEKERLEKDLDYVRRNIAGQNTLQAKGKLKRISREIEAIEQVGYEAVLNKSWAKVSQDVRTSMSAMSVDEAASRLAALRLPVTQSYIPKMNLALRTWQRSGNIVLRTHDLLVGYSGRPLFTAPNLELLRLECAALIGANGTGKTTFLKTILGQIDPLSGEVELGASLRVGYFAQTHAELKPENTLIDEIDRVAPQMLPEQIRSYLGRFLFSGDDANKQVKTLSGGERSRLALAKLALADANFLLLDEPTNHLDIPSQEILQAVLAEFQGTILLVSHDRYLIDRLASQVWELKPAAPDEPWKVEVFRGTYSAYHEKQVVEEALDTPAPLPDKPARPDLAAQRALKNRQLADQRRRAARLNELEDEIARLEVQVKELEERLAVPPADFTEIQSLGELYVNSKDELERCYQEWETLQ